jgi:8-oxo-dGTP diphosphatase
MENNQEKRPKVGTGIFVMNDKTEVLFLKRKGSHGSDTWCLPGGHLEFGESFLENAIRETKEETDLDVRGVEVAGTTNDFFEKEQKHYVTVFMIATNWSGEPKIMEPDRCAEMAWFGLRALPSPLFISDINFFEMNPICLCGSEKKWRECHGDRK